MDSGCCVPWVNRAGQNTPCMLVDLNALFVQGREICSMEMYVSNPSMPCVLSDRSFEEVARLGMMMKQRKINLCAGRWRKVQCWLCTAAWC